LFLFLFTGYFSICGKIQDQDEDYYRQFNIIIAGLDSIEARRWINGLLVNMVDIDDEGNIDPDTVIPFIDGGTEGFKGQARVILPRITSCFECSLDAFPPQVNYPICTIANTPRLPEHCIEWAHIIQWPKEFPSKNIFYFFILKFIFI
jgi:ubiquitin-activating enzyme E1 C